MRPDLDVGRRFVQQQGGPGALVVGVTGAHFYGFPSADSDLDLKGVHVAPTREVVSLKPPRDAVDLLGVFEAPILARGAVSQRFFHHYRGFFGRTRREWTEAESPTVKGLLYAYRSALTGIHLLRTGECIGDVTQLAPTYGFDRVPDLVARKAGGRDHDPLAETTGYDGDLDQLDRLLEAALAESPLPPEPANVAAVDDFLIRVRKAEPSPSTPIRPTP